MTISDETYALLGAKLKLIGHAERLRILDVIRRDAECVCHLETLLRKPQPYVSQQLRLMRDAGLIQDEKQGQNVYYRLADAQVAAWLDVIWGRFVMPKMRCAKSDGLSMPKVR
ncbi:MAG: helix-turn-helix transcriptional regulator [Anaerolineales bacterium]|nr:helix-turn-helix transcriptional regulator [Anaerolineales bacterium]